MAPLTTVTALEMQILEVMARLPEWSIGCEVIVDDGTCVFHFDSGWGGIPRTRTRGGVRGTRTYPKINFALSRLAKKGLVARTDSETFEQYKYRAGRWKLTDTGKTLMGVTA